MRKAAALLIAIASLTACSSTPLDSTESVCDEFAGYVKHGGDRAEVVKSMGKAIDNAKTGVQDAYKTLTNTADGGPAASTADDTFAQACFDAGWKG